MKPTTITREIDPETKDSNARILEYLNRGNLSCEAIRRFYCFINGLKPPKEIRG